MRPPQNCSWNRIIVYIGVNPEIVQRDAVFWRWLRANHQISKDIHIFLKLSYQKVRRDNVKDVD